MTKLEKIVKKNDTVKVTDVRINSIIYNMGYRIMPEDLRIFLYVRNNIIDAYLNDKVIADIDDIDILFDAFAIIKKDKKEFLYAIDYSSKVPQVLFQEIDYFEFELEFVKFGLKNKKFLAYLYDYTHLYNCVTDEYIQRLEFKYIPLNNVDSIKCIKLKNSNDTLVFAFNEKKKNAELFIVFKTSTSITYKKLGCLNYQEVDIYSINFLYDTTTYATCAFSMKSTTNNNNVIFLSRNERLQSINLKRKENKIEFLAHNISSNHFALKVKYDNCASSIIVFSPGNVIESKTYSNISNEVVKSVEHPFLFTVSNDNINFGIINQDDNIVLPFDFENIKVENCGPFGILFIIAKNSLMGVRTRLNVPLIPLEYNFLSIQHKNNTLYISAQKEENGKFINIPITLNEFIKRNIKPLFPKEKFPYYKELKLTDSVLHLFQDTNGLLYLYCKDINERLIFVFRELKGKTYGVGFAYIQTLINNQCYKIFDIITHKVYNVEDYIKFCKINGLEIFLLESLEKSRSTKINGVPIRYNISSIIFYYSHDIKKKFPISFFTNDNIESSIKKIYNKDSMKDFSLIDSYILRKIVLHSLYVENIRYVWELIKVYQDIVENNLDINTVKNKYKIGISSFERIQKYISFLPNTYYIVGNNKNRKLPNDMNKKMYLYYMADISKEIAEGNLTINDACIKYHLDKDLIKLFLDEI